MIKYWIKCVIKIDQDINTKKRLEDSLDLFELRRAAIFVIQAGTQNFLLSYQLFSQECDVINKKKVYLYVTYLYKRLYTTGTVLCNA